MVAMGLGLTWSCEGAKESPHGTTESTESTESTQPTQSTASPPAEIAFPPQPEKIEKLYDHSIAVAEWAIYRLSKQLAEPIFILADTHRRFGFNERAIEAYRRGLRLTPSRPDILMEIGFLLSQRDDFKDAVKEYEKALVLDPKLAGARPVTRDSVLRRSKSFFRIGVRF